MTKRTESRRCNTPARPGLNSHQLTNLTSSTLSQPTVLTVVGSHIPLIVLTILVLLSRPTLMTSPTRCDLTAILQPDNPFARSLVSQRTKTYPEDVWPDQPVIHVDFPTGQYRLDHLHDYYTPKAPDLCLCLHEVLNHRRGEV